MYILQGLITVLPFLNNEKNAAKVFMEHNIHSYSFGIFGKLIQSDHIKLDRGIGIYSIRSANFRKFIAQHNTIWLQ